MKKSKREKEPTFELDLLTEEEKQMFLGNLKKFSGDIDFNHFIGVFDVLTGEKEHLLKKQILRFNDGLAILDGNPGSRFRGKFFVMQEDKFYKVYTDKKMVKGDTARNLKDREETFVSSIFLNGYNKIDNSQQKAFFEQINQLFWAINN